MHVLLAMTAGGSDADAADPGAASTARMHSPGLRSPEVVLSTVCWGFLQQNKGAGCNMQFSTGDTLPVCLHQQNVLCCAACAIAMHVKAY